MVLASKTFRIFVSSTFSDLKEERHALQQHVFPKLRELCMQHGCRFQAIDLRWGVSGEAALDQQTMNICLQELKRCQTITPRPNFIVLLGDRYGWRPLPPQIEAKEFEVILDKIPPEDRELLLWDEQQPEDRKGWYRKDENAAPAEYCLRPREVKVPENATKKEKQAALDSEDEEWKRIEKTLRATIRHAIDELGWPGDDPRRIKYEASATHQEILHGALGVPDAHEHVYCFFREIKDLPHEPKAEDFIDLDDSGHRDKETHKQLKSLKEKLRHRLPGNYFDYKASWTGSGVTTEHIGDLPDNIEDILKQGNAGKDFGKLCTDVYACLSRVILKQIEQLEELDALDTEITAHDNFAQERAKFFTGRTGILQSISDYLKGPDTHPLAIYGDSGSGKTAVIARAAQKAREDNPDTVVSRLIGATPSSSDGRALLESLCRQISRCYGADQSTVPAEYQKLVQEFPERLALATKEKPLILFLDALDQLSDTDNARSLAWLPPNLPENVRLIVSSLPGECLSALESKLPAENLKKLEPMPPDEGQELLNLWLEDAGRKLQSYQRDEVLGKFERCGSPLYLKLAFEEAHRWKSYTEEIELSKDIPGVIHDLFTRLSLDANHGEMIVSHSLGYLAAAKNGLTEDELLDVLSRDEEVFQDFIKRAFHEPPEKRLPVVMWSRLFFDLEPYLTERTADGTSLMTFYHPTTFGQAVMTEYLAGDTKREHHRILARYFEAQKLHTEKDGEKTANLRKLSELPYQQTYGELWDDIEQTLCDLHFIEAKCASGMTYDLISDYATALNALPEAQEERQKELEHEARVKKYTQDLIAFARGEIPSLEIIPSVEPWSEERIREDTERIINNPTRLDRIRAFSQFVNSESHGLVKFASYPGFCMQQAYNSASSGPVASGAESIVNAGVDDVLLLHQPSQRPDYNPHPTLLRTIDAHAETVEYVLTSGGQTLPVTQTVNTVAITPDGRRAVSGGYDETLRVWDLDSGECLKTLEGHTDSVTSVSITADGKRAVSGGRDGSIRVWDLNAGDCLKTLTRRGESVTITPDGRKAVSGGYKTIRVWDLDSGECLKTLEGHTGSVTSVSITPDGKRAVSGSWDKTLRVWDLESGECLKTLEGHTKVVESVSITPDGRRAVSGSDDETLRVWDLESGECLKTLEGQTDSVYSVSITPDGRRAVSGSRDKTLFLWDLDSGECLKTLEGHTGCVVSVSITSDGRRAVSGGDKTVRLWDLETGKHPRALQRHMGMVYSVALASDGRRAVSAGLDGTLRLWDLQSGACLTILQRDTDAYSVGITPDGRRAVSAGLDCTLRLWDLDAGECLKTLEGHHEQVNTVAITPDGRRAVSGSEDKTLLLWDLVSAGYSPFLFDRHTDSIWSVAITPDGKRAVSGSEDRTLRLWDLSSGDCLRTLEGHTHWVWSVAITPNGKRAVSGSVDWTLRVWDLSSGDCLRTLEGHTDWVWSVAITPDGKRAISGSKDRTLRLWDLESGECIAIHRAESTPVLCTNMAAVATGHFVFGTEMGEVVVVIGRNLPMEPPSVTPVRIWRYGEKGNKGRWDDDITAVCQWCGQRFTVSEEVLNVITAIVRNAKLSSHQSPCLELPAEAWEEPRLLSECPNCGKPLTFNPFMVDNRNRY